MTDQPQQAKGPARVERAATECLDARVVTEPEWLTTAGLSQALDDIPIATIRHWRHVGMGPAYVKFGGAVRYSRVAVERWIAAGGDRIRRTK